VQERGRFGTDEADVLQAIEQYGQFIGFSGGNLARTVAPGERT
jgi:hypothetical protein